MKKKIVSLIAAFSLLFQVSVPSFADKNDSSSGDQLTIFSMQNYSSSKFTVDDKGFWIAPQSARMNNPKYKEYLDKAKKITKGKAHSVSSVPVNNVTTLQIDTDLCGLAIEPYSGDQIQVTYYGDNQKDFSFQSKQSGNTLNLTVKGSQTKERYVNPYPEKRYNTYVLQIPAKSIKELSITEGVGTTLAAEVGIPQVKGTSTYGNIFFEGDKFTSSYTVDVKQGTVDMTAKEITGNLNLSATQGWVDVSADSITGTTNCSSVQGWVDIVVGKLAGKTNATSKQGWVDLVADSITADVNLESEQGWVEASIKKEPQNLRVTSPTNTISVADFPNNWKTDSKNSCYIGSGTPVLTLKGSWITFGIGANSIDLDERDWEWDWGDDDWVDDVDDADEYADMVDEIQDKLDRLTDKISDKTEKEVAKSIEALEKELARLEKELAK